MRLRQKNGHSATPAGLSVTCVSASVLKSGSCTVYFGETTTIVTCGFHCCCLLLFYSTRIYQFISAFIIFVFSSLLVILLRVTTRFAPSCYTGLLHVTTRLCSQLLHGFCSQLLHEKFEREKSEICGLNESLADEATNQVASIQCRPHKLALGTDSSARSGRSEKLALLLRFGWLMLDSRVRRDRIHLHPAVEVFTWHCECRVNHQPVL